MGPFRLVDEFLNKHGANYRAGFSSRTNVLDIGDV